MDTVTKGQHTQATLSKIPLGYANANTSVLKKKEEKKGELEGG